jgi:hypothetical protein
MGLAHGGVHWASVNYTVMPCGHGVKIVSGSCLGTMMFMHLMVMSGGIINFTFGKQMHSTFPTITGPFLPNL